MGIARSSRLSSGRSLQCLCLSLSESAGAPDSISSGNRIGTMPAAQHPAQSQSFAQKSSPRVGNVDIEVRDATSLSNALQLVLHSYRDRVACTFSLSPPNCTLRTAFFIKLMKSSSLWPPSYGIPSLLSLGKKMRVGNELTLYLIARGALGLASTSTFARTHYRQDCIRDQPSVI